MTRTRKCWSNNFSSCSTKKRSRSN